MALCTMRTKRIAATNFHSTKNSLHHRQHLLQTHEPLSWSKTKKNQLLPFRTSRNWRRKENERKNKKNEKRNKLNIDFTIVKNQTQLKFSDRLSNTSSHSIFRFFFFSSFPRRSVGEKLMIFHFTFIQFNFTSSIQAEWWWLCRFPTLNSP